MSITIKLKNGKEQSFSCGADAAQWMAEQKALDKPTRKRRKKRTSKPTDKKE